MCGLRINNEPFMKIISPDVKIMSPAMQQNISLCVGVKNKYIITYASLTLYRAEVSTGYILPSSSNLHF